jgi:hypothetical protein
VTELEEMRARYEHALAEVEEIKRTLAERAQHVAELELQLMRQVEEGARENRRAHRWAMAEPTESDLSRAVAAAEAEKALAQAEREALDERERNIRRVERELAGLRVKLEEERRRSWGSAPAPPQPPPDEPQPETEPPPPRPLPQPPSEPELDPAASSRRRSSGR